MHDGATRRALSAAGFTDDSQGLATQNVERNARHRIDLQSSASDAELDHQVLDPQQSFAFGTQVRFARASHQRTSAVVVDARFSSTRRS